MEKTINRVGLSWLYDDIKQDLITVYNLIKTEKDIELNYNIISDALRQSNIRLSRLAKVFYILNVHAGVFLINEFRLSLKYLESHYSTLESSHNLSFDLDIISSNIQNILNYIDDIIQGFNDLHIYYLSVIDELRIVRKDVFFSQCSYISNSVAQHNISAFINSFTKEQSTNINKALKYLKACYGETTINQVNNRDLERELYFIDSIKNSLQGTSHYMLWEVIGAYIYLEKNYDVKLTIVIQNILYQIVNIYNSINEESGLEKINKSVPNWLSTLCSNLIFSDHFQKINQDLRDKIVNILIIHDKKSLSNYLDFAHRMQDTDGWILILDIASELDMAINKLQEYKRKKRVDLNWLFELMQKHIDSCVLTGTYEPLEYYYHTISKINQYTSTGGYINSEDLEEITEFCLKLIKNVEQVVSKMQSDNSIINEMDDNGMDDHKNTIEQETYKILLKQQIKELDDITTEILTKNDNTVTIDYIAGQLHNIVNICNIINFKPGAVITDQYINKIRDAGESTLTISNSLRNNLIVFIKYLSEIFKSLYNNRDYNFHLYSIKKLLNTIEIASLPSVKDQHPAIHDRHNDTHSVQIAETNETSLNSTKDSLVTIFYDEAEDIIENIYNIINKWLEQPSNNSLTEGLQRELHTIKGAAKMVQFPVISDWAHHLEDVVDNCINNINYLTREHIVVIESGINILASLIESYKQNTVPTLPKKLNLDNLAGGSAYQPSIASIINQKEKSAKAMIDCKPTIPLRQKIRVDKDELDSLLDSSCELKVGQYQLKDQTNSYNQVIDKLKTVTSRLKEHPDVEGFKSSLHMLDLIIKQMKTIKIKYDGIVKSNDINVSNIFDRLVNLRMVPLNAIKSRLEYLATSIANDLDKKINFKITRIEGTIDRIILEQITPCLEHLIRNAIDHGIEDNHTRSKFNKPAAGNIELDIYIDSSSVVIKLTDDGAGLDIEKIKYKAFKLGLISSEHELSNDELLAIITSSKFSTVETLSQISGRGVGLDVVKNTVNNLCGVIALNSKWHYGTEFIIKIPFSLTKQPLVYIKICDIVHAVPALIIDQMLNIKKLDLVYKDNNVTMYDDIEIYNMFDLLNLDKRQYQDYCTSIKKQGKYYKVLVFNYKNSKLGFIVDDILESRDSVVRPLSYDINNIREFMGGTVYKDGRVVLILDIINILSNFVSRKQDLSITHNLDYTTNVLPSFDKTDSSKINILAVEDSSTIRHAIEYYLGDIKYNLLTAVDGIDAMKKIEQFTPDLILLDISMPRMNGLDFLKQIRTQEKFRNTPVIIMTSRDEQIFKDLAMKLNVEVYLNKPYDQQKLLNAIDYVLE